MKSLQTKIILLVLFSSIMLAFVLSLVVFVNVNAIIEQNAVLNMSGITQSQRIRFNNFFYSIEDTTGDLATRAQSKLNSINDLKDENVRKEYISDLSRFAIDIANNTYGAISVYLRLDPSIAGGKEGFFYAKKKWKKTFLELPNTDLSEQNATKLSWWDVPKSTSKSSWLSPYFNENLDLIIISYVVPFFDKNKNFVGIVGMDLDFGTFLNMSQNFVLYNNGTAHLVDVENKKVFNNVDSANLLQTTNEHTDHTSFSDLAENTSNEDRLREYEKDGKKHKLAFDTLRNGMKYVIHAPKDEIYEHGHSLLIIMYSIIAFALLLSCLIAFLFSKRIIKPLLELNYASKQISEGHYDVDIQRRSNDEVGELSDSINNMASKIKAYMAQMSNLAYKDALTGIRNKIAYENYIKDIKGEYSLALFSINNFNIVNEKYDRSTSDALVLMACRYICKVFSHSAVFRLENEQFAAILSAEDHENIAEILKTFEEKMGENELEVPPYCALSIAYGVCSNADNKSFSEVQKQANTNMLENKRKMKTQ